MHHHQGCVLLFCGVLGIVQLGIVQQAAGMFVGSLRGVGDTHQGPVVHGLER